VVKTVRPGKTGSKPDVLTERDEEILKTVHFYRYMTALDVGYRLYSPSVLRYVRSLLTRLSGGDDHVPDQYLYRFRLPKTTVGNVQRIYTLGSKGRDFLANEVGLPVEWYFRPGKVNNLSFSTVLHSLVLTRFLVAAQRWSAKHPEFRLVQTRICYELEKAPPAVAFNKAGKIETLRVVPDAWLLFEKWTGETREHSYPVLLEIDRGTEYQHKFKQHVRARLEFIKKGGLYGKVFGVEAVMIAYATVGQTSENGETRRATMCRWTQEVLAELNKQSWASVFRFHSLSLDDIYAASLFEEPVWYQPGLPEPVTLFPP